MGAVTLSGVFMILMRLVTQRICRKKGSPIIVKGVGALSDSCGEGMFCWGRESGDCMG